MEERLIKVEAKLDGFVSDMDAKDRLAGYRGVSLPRLAVLEEKNNNVSETMKRAFHQIDTGRRDKTERSIPHIYSCSPPVASATSVSDLLIPS